MPANCIDVLWTVAGSNRGSVDHINEQSRAAPLLLAVTTMIMSFAGVDQAFCVGW